MVLALACGLSSTIAAEVAKCFRVVAVGDEEEIAGVAQCLGKVRHGGVPGGIFSLPCFARSAAAQEILRDQVLYVIHV